MIVCLPQTNFSLKDIQSESEGLKKIFQGTGNQKNIRNQTRTTTTTKTGVVITDKQI